MMLILLILMAVVFFLFREIYARLWSEGAEADISVEEPYIYANEKVSLTETVVNRGRFPLPVLEVRFRLPKGPVFENAENVVVSDNLYKRDVFSLRPQEQVTRRYLIRCPRRGRYPVCDLTVKAWSFWHSRAYELKQKTNACLTVYAARTDVSEILAHCNSVLGTLESRRRTFEDPFAWASIRAYTPQDPMRNINWKASARTGEMMVNTWTSVQAVQFCIFLDAMDERIVKQEELTELGISAAASLASKLIGSGQETGLYIYSDIQSEQTGVKENEPQSEPGFRQNTGLRPAAGSAAEASRKNDIFGIHIPPARGRAQLTRIEQTLTEDLTGYAHRRSGKSSRAELAADAENRNGKCSRAEQTGPAEKAPGFAQWALQKSSEAAGECINVFLSKEEDTLEELETRLRGTGRNRRTKQNMPAILVRPVIRDGKGELKVCMIM